MLKQVLNGLVLSLILSQSLCSVSFAEDDDTIAMAGGKVVAYKPADWKDVKPKISMIEHEFVAPKEGEEKDQARITVMQAGGTVEANIERWKSQFEALKKDDVKTEDKEVGTAKVHIVDMSGTYLQKSGGPFTPGPAERLENYRLLGVIIETKTSGKVFIKMTGPKDTVEKLKDGMTKLVDSIEIK
jgi:hypothetical protein